MKACLSETIYPFIEANKDNPKLDKYIQGKKDSEYNFYTYPCKKWVFGMNILRLADVRTFNLEDNEVTLYFSKKQNVIINEKDGDF